MFKRGEWGFAVGAAQSGLGVPSAAARFGPVDAASWLPSVPITMVQSVQEEFGFRPSFERGINCFQGGARGVLDRGAPLWLRVFFFPEHAWYLSPV